MTAIGPHRLGIDIGGTKIEAVLLAPDGTVVAGHRRPTGFGAEEVVASILTAVDTVLAAESAAGLQASELSIGVGIPGTIDSSSGTVSHALNLGIEHLELGRVLSERLGTAVTVENDVNAAALGAFHLVGTPGSQSLAYLNLGTGLAAGLVLRGELWRGARGAAGEIGHILIDPNGPIDLDGQRGGIEVVASGSGIARQWGAAGDNSVSAVFDAAEAGDARAIEIRRRLFEGVAASVRILVLTVDVDSVVIGGGITGLGERLTAGVRAVIAGWEEASPFIASLELGQRLSLLAGDTPVAAIGAAWLGASAPTITEGAR